MASCVRAVWVAALLFAAPAAFAEDLWRPGSEELNALTVAQGLEQVRSGLADDEINLCGFQEGLIERSQNVIRVTGAAVTLRCSGINDPVVLGFRTHSLYGLDANGRTEILVFCTPRDGAAYYSEVGALSSLCVQSSGRTPRYNQERLRRLITAWMFLSLQAGRQEPSDDDLQAELLRAPPISAERSEQLGRLRAQAEQTARDNRVLDAVQLYRMALNETPNWAEGQFNQAILLGDLEFYTNAIIRLRSYLILRPDAPDASIAQNRIAEWRAAVERLDRAEARVSATADVVDSLTTMRTFFTQSVWGCKPEVLNLRPMPNIRQESLRVTGSGVSFDCGDPGGGGDEAYRYRYTDYPTPWFAFVAGGVHFCLEARDLDRRCLEHFKVQNEVRQQPDAMRTFSDAWQVMARPRAVLDPAADPTMRSAGPENTEDLRRVQVQVELALRENRNLDAARLYRDALRTSPGWADGHYNLGLLYGDLELFPEAITEMRRYLYLTPNAQDARAVQDRIYEWEAAMRTRS